jgi:hypothetical protein
MTTILYVPAEGDPHGVLKAGKCGARPPLMWRAADRGETWLSADATSDWTILQSRPLALVLAHEGEPVAEGVDRLRRTLAIREGCPFDPANVVLCDDLYRAQHYWRLVMFRWSGHGRRWGKSYAGKPVRLQEFEHVPGLVAGDGSGMALVNALGAIASTRLGGRVIVLP